MSVRVPIQPLENQFRVDTRKRAEKQRRMPRDGDEEKLVKQKNLLLTIEQK